MPTHFHAIVWIDHSEAKVFHIGLSGQDEVTLHPLLPTRHLHHKANSIGSGHAGFDKEFFAQVMNAVSDAASAATLAHACLTSAGYNVRININGLGDRTSGESLLGQLQALEVRARKLEKDLHHTLIDRGGIYT